MGYARDALPLGLRRVLARRGRAHGRRAPVFWRRWEPRGGRGHRRGCRVRRDRTRHQHHDRAPGDHPRPATRARDGSVLGAAHGAGRARRGGHLATGRAVRRTGGAAVPGRGAGGADGRRGVDPAQTTRRPNATKRGDSGELHAGAMTLVHSLNLSTS